MTLDAIDAHLHLWDVGDGPDLDDKGSADVTATLRRMDGAGVVAALAVSPWYLYGYDSSYVLEACERHPSRLRAVVPVDPLDSGVGERVDELVAMPYVAGIRIMLRQLAAAGSAALADSPLFERAAREGLPVSATAAGQLALLGTLASRHPACTFVVDHAGLVPADAAGDSIELASLAAHSNVVVKLSALPALSEQQYPFADIHPLVSAALRWFGAGRVIWGSDWTQLAELLTYEQSRDWLASALTESELPEVLGTTLRRVYRWQK